MGELRERKKRATRQRISDIATELFFERGFESVTIDEVAARAEVSKVTVFNYFPRKEDLFLDREEEIFETLRAAFQEGSHGASAVDALWAVVKRMREEKHPFVRVDARTVGWWRVVAASPALRARVRELGDDVSEELAVGLGGAKPSAVARLAAGIIAVTWRTAFAEGIRVFERTKSATKAGAELGRLMEIGFGVARGVIGNCK